MFHLITAVLCVSPRDTIRSAVVAGKGVDLVLQLIDADADGAACVQGLRMLFMLLCNDTRIAGCSRVLAFDMLIEALHIMVDAGLCHLATCHACVRLLVEHQVNVLHTWMPRARLLLMRRGGEARCGATA